MAYEEVVMELMEKLVIADKHVIGDIMSFYGYWKNGTSAVNNSYKALTNLSGLGKLVKGDGYFKLPDCKSEYKEHAQLVTKAISEFLKNKEFEINVRREPYFEEVGLRPDAVFLIKGEKKGICFILEVCNNETPEYLMQKINAWTHWEKAKVALSKTFNTVIPVFDVVSAGLNVEGSFELKAYHKEVFNEN